MKPKNEYSRFSFSSIPCDLDTGDTSEDSLVPILSNLITFSHSLFRISPNFLWPALLKCIPSCSAVGELDSRCLCGQFHNCRLSTQSKGDSFSSSQQLDCVADSQVGRVGAFDSRPAVHHWQEQCPRGRSPSTQSNPGFRVDS